MDTQISWNMWTVTLWLVHFAERNGNKLATFTVVNLIANISYDLITVKLLLFLSLCCCVLPRHSEGKGTDICKSSRCSASTVQPGSADQNF